MNRTTGVLKMHWRDKWVWIYVPWVVLLFSFAINVIIGILMNGQEHINSGGIASIYVYMFIAILIVQAQTFPFSLGMSIRRMDYFIGTSLMCILVSAGSSAILFLLSVVEDLSDGWGVNLGYFYMPFMSDLSPIARFGIYFVVMMQMFFLGFAISSIHRRFGKNGLYVFFTVLLLLSSIGSFAMTYYERWMDLFIWISHHYMELFVWMIPLIAVYALLSYSMLRRSTVS
ncbi:hypothetical protein J23TS9_28480 [Paenibacillus sp. J23TS9]|uniref:hypothetical protein n=1 Tax=Paenibacillus sp. J23TS9 TaxID=2807193 RepID=UPI001B2F396B|nr:hypothetical protein [Paenibacillus sp. J23TS9]GIP27718.1 hypothetical protein J23TS9_28480 [Paenibacillus sp. J23TS9]